MTCPNCGMDWLKPEAIEHGPEPVRRYCCPKCGFRWETVELVRATAQRQAFQATMFGILNRP